MKIRDYLIPGSLDEAHRMLRDLGPEGLPVAGATSHPFMNATEQRVAVDLCRTGMDRIRSDGARWTIGAMVTIDHLYRQRGAGWVLNEPSDDFVSQQIRNVSTLGGNIARVFPWCDFPVALLVLDAAMTLQGNARHVLTSDEYFKGQPARHFQPGDLLTEISVESVPQGSGFAFVKQRRTSADFGQATAAARVALKGKEISDIRVALGAAVAIPVRLRSLEQALTGRQATESTVREAVESALSGTKFRSVSGMTEEYIGHVARVITGDAVLQACARAGGVA